MCKSLVKLLCLVLMTVIVTYAPAQKKKKIKLIEAASFEGGKNALGEYRLWKGDLSAGKQAVFKHQNTMIYCDSAYQNVKNNTLEAVGNVRIEQGDSITVTANKLNYDGDTKLAQLRGNVILTDDSLTLLTENLDYDMPKNLGYYFGGGKILDEENILTSDKGYYHTNSKVVTFREDVHVTNPEYTMESDTLYYDTQTKIVRFEGPTKIVSVDGETITATQGTYDTQREQSQIKGAIETPEYIIKGDRLFFDDAQSYYEAKANIQLTAKEDDLIITGDVAQYWREDGITKIYGNPVMQKIMEGDTLFLSADTLVSVEDQATMKRFLFAYHDVRIFKSDMQGLTDSLAYHIDDSVLYFYKDPIMWNGDNQMVADSINIYMANDQIDRLYMSGDAFVVSQDTLTNFNQIKGKTITANFRENEIDHILVDGNGESIYFALEGDTVMVGMNKILCGKMNMRFEEQELSTIKFYTNPEGKFIPPHELQDLDRKLIGFEWRIEEKPTRELVTNRALVEVVREEDIE